MVSKPWRSSEHFILFTFIRSTIFHHYYWYITYHLLLMYPKWGLLPQTTTLLPLLISLPDTDLLTLWSTCSSRYHCMKVIHEYVFTDSCYLCISSLETSDLWLKFNFNISVLTRQLYGKYENCYVCDVEMYRPWNKFMINFKDYRKIINIRTRDCDSTLLGFSCQWMYTISHNLLSARLSTLKWK